MFVSIWMYSAVNLRKKFYVTATTPAAQSGPAAQPAAAAAPGAQNASQSASPQYWACSCGASNTGKFCGNCGARRPEPKTWACSCGATNSTPFCGNCGAKRP